MARLVSHLKGACARLQNFSQYPGYSLLWACGNVRRSCASTGLLRQRLLSGTAMILRSAIRVMRGRHTVNLPDLWFADKEAIAATRERNHLLELLSGRIHFGAKGTKPHKGALSPGCVICQDGGWGCNLINRLCTRDCFFCKRWHTPKTELDPETEGCSFPDANAHAEFARCLGVRGIGFSGGEPLLVPDRLLSHLQIMKKEFGESIYLWMYTNGDLVTPDLMKDLARAGLNEIRFNLAARDYDLAPLVIARAHIPTVTVEIPAIPEDFERMKLLMKEMQLVGVDFLNLHQLTIEAQNWRFLLNRPYRLNCAVGLCVHESELCALRLMLHACESGLRLPVNYCSSIYKARFQQRGYRARRGMAISEPFEEITQTGHLRTLKVRSSREQIAALSNRMPADGCQIDRWKIQRGGQALVLHSSLMPYVNWQSSRLSIQYSEPAFVLRNRPRGFLKTNLKPAHRPVMKAEDVPESVFLLLRERYLIPRNTMDPSSASPDDLLHGESLLLKRLAAFEEIESGLPDVR
jgi:pyruvate formate-lyase activating enzyme-like uncharacterized protein